MSTTLLTIQKDPAPSPQRRTSHPKFDSNWRQYAILAMTLRTASLQAGVLVNNLNQPVAAWDGPIGTDASANDFLIGQEITLPAANYASYVINKVSLRLRPNGAAASVTASIWSVDALNNNPASKIATVASHLVSITTNVDFVPATNIVLLPGMYYVVAAPTTSADNAKVSWAYTDAWTNWSGTGILGSFASTYSGSWQNLPVYQSPFLLDVEATPTIGSVAMSRKGDATSLSWPAALTGFVPEGTTSLVSSNWQTITNQTVQVGNQLVLSNSRTDSSRFFRLRQPFAINNLAQWPAGPAGPLGTNANSSDYLVGQEFTLPTGNWAIDKVTLVLSSVSGSAHITASLWHVGSNNLPTTQISTVSSALVASASPSPVDFVPSAPITLSGGSYCVIAAPTAAVDNAKVSWGATFSTFWTGLGTLGGSVDTSAGSWGYYQINYGPQQMSVQVTLK